MSTRNLAGQIASYGLKKNVVAVKGCRKIGKKDMKNNNALPKITVDPESYRVSLFFLVVVSIISSLTDDLASSVVRSKPMEYIVQFHRPRKLLSRKVTCSFNDVSL